MLSVIERGGAVLTSGAPAAIPTFSFIVYYNWDTQLVFVIVMERGPQVNQIRHGDVFLLKATSLVAKGAQSRMAVLAEGEVTGHAHRVTAGPAGGVALETVGSATYLIVTGDGAVLDHEEHGPIPIGDGTWEVRIQRTWDYLAEMERRVAD